MILVIDNYDSFTYNVVQALQRLSGDEVKVVRSKEITVQEIEEMNPARLVISPGPGTPSEAGVSIDAIKYFAGKIPILGVCLGHQAIGEAFGAKIVQAKRICHGVVEEMDLDGRGLFRIIGKKASFTRYHSLVIDESTLSDDFEVTARAKDGDIMGVRHKTLMIEGVQFHPESIASQQGDDIFRAFLNYRRENLPVAQILNTIVAKQDLSEEQACLFMENLADGTLDERVTSAVLAALAVKGPAVSEIVGFAQGLLKVKKPLPAEFHNHAEIVGTGGDGKGSFNISSLSAIICASCGQTVTKHGNRAVSSKSGAADFFENLGINIMADPAKTCSLIQKTGFGFLMATVYHSAMRFAAPVRKTLGIKTIMNIMGPLLNPASAEYEVLGVYSKDLLETYAHAAKKLGAKRVLVITSEDGYDEISPCAVTHCFQINEDGKEYRYTIDPAKFGITDADETELFGGTGADNAALALEVLNGGGRKTIKAAVGLNAGAVLYLSGKAKTIKDGYDMAIASIDSGKALAKLNEIVATSKAE
ncbi:MAG: bifunctional anthranilate synthase component II/anthranilate phosphoribosyltransferase [Treponemataceae bacterium]|nr:bifunctional anthranilate synthase component II/anthranilate phosphoribosyltransferase [Treponemataceae bacterium]